MSAPLWALLVPTLAVLANMAGQIIGYRLLAGRGRLLKSQIGGTVTGFVALGLLSAAGPDGSARSADVLVANLLLYVAFCYVYFHWNNMGETARRIRLLRDLYDAPEGLTVQELQNRYPAREILTRRLKRLIDGGQISDRDGRLFLTSPAVLASARLVGLARWLIFGGRSEFEDHDHISL